VRTETVVRGVLAERARNLERRAAVDKAVLSVGGLAIKAREAVKDFNVARIGGFEGTFTDFVRSPVQAAASQREGATRLRESGSSGFDPAEARRLRDLASEGLGAIIKQDLFGGLRARDLPDTTLDILDSVQAGRELDTDVPGVQRDAFINPFAPAALEPEVL
jgi:hypothetical protein